jgi:predicted transcriptional regulator
MPKFKVIATFVHTLTLSKAIDGKDEKEALSIAVRDSRNSDWMSKRELKTSTK